MATIHVIKPFTLTLSADERRHYAAGTHRDVPDDHATHWFTKLHVGEPEDVSAQPVSPAEFAVLRREAEAVRADLATERERVAALEAELASAKSDLAAVRAEFEELTAPAPAGSGDQARATGGRERSRS